MRRRHAIISIATAILLMLPWAGTANAANSHVRLRSVPVPVYAHQMGVLRPIPAGMPITATLLLEPRNLSALEAATRAVMTPGSGAYHHWWTATQLLKAFGPSSTSIDEVLGNLTQEGFRARKTGWVIQATGSAANWQRLLSLRIATVDRGGEIYHVQTTTGQEPAWLSPVVTGVDGLTNLPAPTTSAKSWANSVLVTKNAHLKSIVVSRTDQATAQSGSFQVTAIVPGGVHKPTGQPIHIILSATLNGMPASDANIVNNSLTVSTNTGAGIMAGNSFVYDGTMEIPIYSQSPQSASIQVTVYSATQNGVPAPGAVSTTVTLPVMTWTGPSTLLALSANDVNSVYHARTLVATSQDHPAPTIGLYEEGPPSASMVSALNTFSQQNGLRPAIVSVVNVTTGTPAHGSGFEENMDLQAVEATAPGANLVVYSDPQNDVGQTLNRVFQQNIVSVLSMSIAFSGTSDLATLADNLALEGITVIASSGDWGTLTGCVPAPNSGGSLSIPGLCQPASFETVTAVGGTDVSVNQNAQAYYTQAWGGVYLASLPKPLESYILSQKSASGGGFSLSQAIPAWQRGFLPNFATGKGIPDVALMADPMVAGLALVSRGGAATVGGGTSLGSPLLSGWVADVLAQMGKNLGPIASTFYGLAGVDPNAFVQATRGDNGQYQITSQDNLAGTWNPITGLGSPNIDAWASFVENGNQIPRPTVRVFPVSYGSSATVIGSWPGISGATFQYWWQDPRDGVWHSSGAYRSGSYTFLPPVSGSYAVLAYARAAGQPNTETDIQTLEVASTGPMVSNLVVNYRGSVVQSVGSTVTFTAEATDSTGTPWYQFLVHGPNNQWVVAKNYGPQNSFTCRIWHRVPILWPSTRSIPPRSPMGPGIRRTPIARWLTWEAV